MSVQSEINRIKSNVSNTYSNLEDMGADMPAEQNTENLAETVLTIKAVRFDEQTLTDSQKAQARTNIGAASAEKVGQLEKTIADYSTLTLGVNPDDGLIYIYKKGQPIGTGIVQGTSGDVVGYIDSENNIILSGALEDGTYTVKYEMEDSTVISIGELVLDTGTVEPINWFIATTDWINKYLSTSSGVFSSRGGSFCVEVDGISLADNNPYIVRISGATLVKDSGDGSYGRIALLKSDGTVVTVQHITDNKITRDGDSWYFDIHAFSSDANITKCRINMCIRTDRSNISLSDVANVFVEFEPLNV